jgi:hypothetical protein
MPYIRCSAHIKPAPLLLLSTQASAIWPIKILLGSQYRQPRPRPRKPTPKVYAVVKEKTSLDLERDKVYVQCALTSKALSDLKFGEALPKGMSISVLVSV